MLLVSGGVPVVVVVVGDHNNGRIVGTHDNGRLFLEGRPSLQVMLQEQIRPIGSSICITIVIPLDCASRTILLIVGFRNDPQDDSLLLFKKSNAMVSNDFDSLRIGLPSFSHKVIENV